MNLFYFNINYTCNSNCKFCAADFELERYSKEMLTLENIRDIAETYGMEKGDKVILNGGEPTLNPYLFDMIRYFSGIGTKTILFTNGRKLNNFKFAAELIEAGVSKITMPVYSSDENVHDAITRIPGSLAQLSQALYNLTSLKHKYRFEIELKTLICRDNCNSLAAIWGGFCSEYVPDVLLISGLIPSDVALSNNQCLNREENKKAVNAILDKLWSQLPSSVSLLLDGIPLCHLSPSNRIFYLARRAKINAQNEEKPKHCYYFNPAYSQAEVVKNDLTGWDEILCPKEFCEYKHVCRLNTLQQHKEFLTKWIEEAI